MTAAAHARNGATSPPDQDRAIIADLRTISHDERALFVDAVQAEPVAGWSYYFPYLKLFSQLTGSERVMFEVMDGSIALYRHRQTPEKAILSLLVPPFPWNERLLRRAMERIQAYNADHKGRIARVSEDLLPRFDGLGFSMRENASEYVYDRAAVLAAQGRPFATLRRKLSKQADAVMRSYTTEDRTPCEALLDRWRAGMTERGIRIGPYRTYARKCLRQAHRFGELMKGEVVEVNGKIAAFSFGGPIGHGAGSMFITVSDHAEPGLAYVQRTGLMRAFPDLATFNDSTDTGRAGMAQMKQTFRPVRMHRLLSARI